MKKTATVTWNSYRNFGTLLQAYALNRVVESLGYSNVVIDDSKVVASFPKKKFSPVRMLRNIPWLFPKRAEFNRKSEQSVRLFEEFKSDYIRMDRDWTDRKTLSDSYDVFLAGSDQIWSPASHFDEFYYLGFTDKLKVAYAPSLGTVVYPDSLVPRVAPYLASFSSLSVREPQGAAILKEKFFVDAEVVADPTMLLDRDMWDELPVDGPKDGRKYALCYFLTYDRSYIDCARVYCRSKGLDMKIIVTSHHFVGVSGAEEIYTGPLGFLTLLKGADAVLTDSFHGTIFSLVYEKPFHTFRRFRDGSPASQNSRLENLLACVNLTDRYVSQDSLQLSDIPIDFIRVGKIITKMREVSLEYLRRSLEKDNVQTGKAYSAYVKDSGERVTAASGGAASVIAKSFIRSGGVVYGCAQGKGVQISHVRIDREEDVACMSGSKYVYSKISHVTGQIRDDLDKGLKVLFIGLPCQVTGVRNLFRNHADLLFTIDLCCHGAPSDKLLAEHLKHIGCDSDADRVIFRTKVSSGIRYVFKVFDSSGQCIYDKPARKDFYMAGFLNSLFIRESCFRCPYAGPERCSDLTLADHWAMGHSDDPEMTLAKGLSTVLINTPEGRTLFELASSSLCHESRPLEEALRNGQFIRPPEKPSDYDDFFRCLDEDGYTAACRRYLPAYMRRMYVHELKSRYYKSTVRQYVRKLLGK